LAINRWFFLVNARTSVGYVLLIVFAAAFGWLLTGAGLILWHAARRTLWPLEPGEWLVLGGAVGFACRCGPTLESGYAYRIETAALVCIAVVFAVGASVQRNNLWWSATMLWLALATLPFIMPVAMYPFVWTPPWPTYLGGEVVLLILMTAGVIADHRRRRPRHWLHWSGVALLALTSAVSVAVLSLADLGRRLF
jgi:hypothetical protein